MGDLGTVEGWPVWHPAREVLEASELVTTGAVAALPAALPLDPPAGDAPGVVLEDAEGTPVAALHRDGDAPAGWRVRAPEAVRPRPAAGRPPRPRPT